MWLPPQKEDIAYYSKNISHIGYLFSICSIWYITNFHVYLLFLSQSVSSRILGQEGSNTWTPRSSFKAVVKDNLLFGYKNWLMNPRVGWNLRGFHQLLDLFLVGVIPQRDIMGW